MSDFTLNNVIEVNLIMQAPIIEANMIEQPMIFESDITLGARGRSAYELWLDDGHTGTLDDFFVWLSSLATALATLPADRITVEDIQGVLQATDVEAALHELANSLSQVVQDKQYVHEQMVAMATWTITHNLNKYPAVTVLDLYGSVVYGDVYYISENVVQIQFSAPFSGKAVFN